MEEVSPLDLASAYLTFANDGTRVEPYAIVRIEDGDGNVLWEPDRPEPEEGAVEPDVARAVTEALRGVIESGTGTAADIGRPAAGKTGTTQDNVDAWFAGYVPGYAAVVWMGHPAAHADGGRHRRRAARRDLAALHDRGHGGPRARGLPRAARRPAPAGPRRHVELDQLVEHRIDDRAADVDDERRGLHHDDRDGSWP